MMKNTVILEEKYIKRDSLFMPRQILVYYHLIIINLTTAPVFHEDWLLPNESMTDRVIKVTNHAQT